MSHNPQSHKLEIIHKKRDYVTQSEKEHLKSFESLSYSKRELGLLGVLRPEVKERMVEIVIRSSHALSQRLKDDLQSFSNQELTVIASTATQRMIELENQGKIEEKIDWNKFDLKSFEGADISHKEPKSD